MMNEITAVSQSADADAAGAVAAEVWRAAGLAEQVHDQGDRGGDDRREGGGHDESDGELDEIAAQDEVLETLHGCVLECLGASCPG